MSSDETDARRAPAFPPTDPQPESTPGLEPGGGVAPGDTPPGEASTSATTFREPELPSERTNWLILGLIVAFVVLVTVFLFVRLWS